MNLRHRFRHRGFRDPAMDGANPQDFDFFQISRVFQPKTLFRLEGTDFFRYRLRTSGPGPLAIRICQNLWLSSKLFYKCSRLTLQLIQQQKMKKKTVNEHTSMSPSTNGLNQNKD